MEQGQHFPISAYLTNLWQLLFSQTWSWWAAGLGIGLTALGLAWFTGKRLGVTGGFENAVSLVEKGKTPAVSPAWKLWFILGIPFGGLLANAGHWNWTWLYGRLDAVTFGNIYFKILWLLAAGFLVGFGARWAGGCVSGNSIMGISTGNKMSLLVTVGFLASGIIITNLLFSLLRIM